MPSIDYAGHYFVRAICTGQIGAPYYVKDPKGALAFPIRASQESIARRFANRKILKLLPGWRVGSVTLFRGDRQRQIDAWILRRE